MSAQDWLWPPSVWSDERAGPGSFDTIQRLVQTVQELSLTRSLSEVQRVVRTAARHLTGADGATFVLRDGDMCFYAEEDAIAPLWKGSRFPLHTCISGWTMLHREAVVISDIFQDARVPHAAYRPTFVKSLVMVPIRTLDPVGAIGNYWAIQRHPSPHEVAVLQALADATSVALENIQVYAELEQRVRDRTAELQKANEEIRQMSITDDLTGVHNRRGFHLLARPALHAARRDGRSCVLGFIDVDALKHINDTLGHAVGDNLIIDVANVLREALRPSDVLARIGGDEFCVLITDPTADPVTLQRQLTEALHTFNETHTRPYRLSTSFGLMQVPATAEARTVEELLTRADELMYQQKKSRPAP